MREVFVNRVAHYPGSGYFLVLGHADYGFVTLLGKRYGDARRFRRVGASILATKNCSKSPWPGQRGPASLGAKREPMPTQNCSRSGAGHRQV